MNASNVKAVTIAFVLPATVVAGAAYYIGDRNIKKALIIGGIAAVAMVVGDLLLSTVDTRSS